MLLPYSSSAIEVWNKKFAKRGFFYETNLGSLLNVAKIAHIAALLHIKL